MTALPYWRVELGRAPATDESVVSAVLNVFREGMQEPDGWHVDGVERSVLRADLALYLVERDEIVGYAFYNSIEVPADPLGRRVLWEESICFLPRYQQRGHGDVALNVALTSLEPDCSFGWIGGRTQNPIVFRRYKRLARAYGRLLPFGAAYDEDEDDNAALAAVSGFFSDRWKDTPDRFGISSKVYSEGTLGKYPDHVAGTELYEQFLTERGFNRNAGDAVIVLANTWSVLERVMPAADEKSPVLVSRLAKVDELGPEVDDLTLVYQATFADEPYRELWDPSHVRPSLDEYAKHGCLFVARLSERIVGFASAGVLGDPKLGRQLPEGIVRAVAVDGRKQIYIDELGVIHDARGRGVAVALLREICGAYGAGAQFVLGTHAANQASITLYRSLGFRLVDVPAYAAWAPRTNGRFTCDFRIALIRG